MSARISNTSARLSKSTLTTQQNHAIARLYEYDETLLVAGTGAGKTVCLLTAISELLDEGLLARVLIVAPLKVCLTAWTTEAGKWDHLAHLGVGIATGTPDERRAVIDGGAPIVVINEENVPWLVSRYSERGAPVGNFDGIAIDETSKWADSGGARFKALRNKMKFFRWRAGVTAQPVGENWVGLFAQLLLLDLGTALGRSRDRYLRRYFYATDWDGRKWEVLPGHESRIAAKIQPLTYVMADYKHELPPKRVEFVPLDMGEAATRVYDRMRIDSLVTFGGVDVIAPTAATLSGKLEQLANGFLYLPEDSENPGARDWITTHDVKAAWLTRRANEITAAGESVVVVYWFAADLAWLRDAFPDALTLGGGLNARGVAATMDRWRTSRGNILLLHPASAGHGVDGLQDTCFRQLWVSPVWGRDKSQQTEDRIWRRGQTHEVFIEIATARKYDGSSTIDQVKRDVCEGKGAHHDLFLEHLAGPLDIA